MLYLYRKEVAGSTYPSTDWIEDIVSERTSTGRKDKEGSKEAKCTWECLIQAS